MKLFPVKIVVIALNSTAQFFCFNQNCFYIKCCIAPPPKKCDSRNIPQCFINPPDAGTSGNRGQSSVLDRAHYNIPGLCFLPGLTAGDASARGPGRAPATAAAQGLAHEALEPRDQPACQRGVWVPWTVNVGPWNTSVCRWFAEGEFWTINKLFSGRKPEFCFVCLYSVLVGKFQHKLTRDLRTLPSLDQPRDWLV